MQFIGASMFKSQYKSNNPYQSWSTIGSYSSESEAINSALRKKTAGALMVRVVTADGNIVFSG
jgi:hypothetical protein